jgi:pimeloyl-ACP methyl ester carboxylesterase
MRKTGRRRGGIWEAAALAVLAAALLAAQTVFGGGVTVRTAGEGRETVVLLHGMRRSGRSMGKMAKALREEGYRTAVVDYPSKWGVHETTEKVFAALGPVTAGVERVHFVTHSLGGILVRDAFREGAPGHLGRVVMQGPPNGGCEHIDRFGWLPFFGAVWGTPARELGTGAESFPNRLPGIGFECGVIAGTKGGALGLLLPGKSDGKVTVARAGEEGVKEVLVLPVNHTWMMRDKRVISAAARFLETGRFGEAAGGGAGAAP